MPYACQIIMSSNYIKLSFTQLERLQEFQSDPVQQKLCQDHCRAIFSVRFSHWGLSQNLGGCSESSVEVLTLKEPWKTFENHSISRKPAPCFGTQKQPSREGPVGWPFLQPLWRLPTATGICQVLGNSTRTPLLIHSVVFVLCILNLLSLQTPRLPALDPAYLLTCSNPCVGWVFLYFAKPKTLKT